MTIEPLGDGEIRRFRQGDPQMFRRIVERYSPRLMSVAITYAVDRDDARDLLQEVWFRVFRKRGQFVGRGSLIGWLYSICRTVCLDATAKRQTRDRLAPEALQIQPEYTPGSEDLVHRSEVRRSLHEALLALPTREREVAIMRMIEGRSTRETARLLGIAEGTVKAALHHAIKKLKSSMEVWVS